jgi:hypothetical protein
MFLAENPNGRRIGPEPKARGACPSCKAEVISKCGKVVTWHWAHKSGADCDPWSEMTAWHFDWQGNWPERQREWVIGEHRADILTVPSHDPRRWWKPDVPLVVEFQHSYLPSDEISEREEYYSHHAGQMIWVWDCRKPYREGRLFPTGNLCTAFTWKHFRSTLSSCTWPAFLDIGRDFLLAVDSWPEMERELVDYYVRDGGGDEASSWKYGWGQGRCHTTGRKSFIEALQIPRAER